MIELLSANYDEGTSYSVPPTAHLKQEYRFDFFVSRSKSRTSSTSSSHSPLAFFTSNSMSEYWGNLAEETLFHSYLKEDETDNVPDITTKELIAEVEQYRISYDNFTYSEILEKVKSREITYYSLAEIEIWKELEELLADRLKEGL